METTIGARLASKRQEQGRSLADVAEATGIAPEQLDALEQGAGLHGFDGRARVWVVSRELGLDPAQVLRELPRAPGPAPGEPEPGRDQLDPDAPVWLELPAPASGADAHADAAPEPPAPSGLPPLSDEAADTDAPEPPTPTWPEGLPPPDETADTDAPEPPTPTWPEGLPPLSDEATADESPAVDRREPGSRQQHRGVAGPGDAPAPTRRSAQHWGPTRRRPLVSASLVVLLSASVTATLVVLTADTRPDTDPAEMTESDPDPQPEPEPEPEPEADPAPPEDAEPSPEVDPDATAVEDALAGARPPGETTVQLLDASGAAGAADAAQQALGDIGYQVVASSPALADRDQTVVWFSEGWENEAEALVARDGRFGSIAPNDGLSPEVNLHVLVGADWVD